jgi:hypothetical protein
MKNNREKQTQILLQQDEMWDHFSGISSKSLQKYKPRFSIPGSETTDVNKRISSIG